MDAGFNYASAIDANIARFKDAGFECRITELDLGIDDKSEENLQKQALGFYSMAHIAMKHDNCKSLLIWGLSDDLTWRTGRNPLLFNSNLTKKPAYWGVHAALRESVDVEETSITPQILTPNLSTPTPYNLLGQRVKVLEKGKIYIVNGKKYIH